MTWFHRQARGQGATGGHGNGRAFGPPKRRNPRNAGLTTKHHEGFVLRVSLAKGGG
jgi:hypothetical protein